MHYVDMERVYLIDLFLSNKNWLKNALFAKRRERKKKKTNLRTCLMNLMMEERLQVIVT